MHNKFFAIFCLVIGFVIFGLAIAIAEEGWQPSQWQPIPSHTKSTVLDVVPVIAQDTPTNITVPDSIPVPSVETKINLPEMVITPTPTTKPVVNPGAARRRQTNQLPAENSRSLVSPTGLASEAALNYQPFNVASPEYVGHTVRGPGARAADRAYSVPSRGLQRPEHETWEFEVK